MKRLLFFGLIAGTLAACSKDKFKTVPQVEITSFGPPEVQKGQIIQLVATVTDEEGDLQDSVIVYRKIFNGTTLLTTDSLITANLINLGVPSKRKIEIELTLIYGELRPEIGILQNGDPVDRNFSIGLFVKDKAGNRSEYVESEKIILKKI